MKQQILFELNNKLQSMGIVTQQGNGADITINTEFLDAGWSTGNKKISYEALVFANEQDETVYMYEKTIEIGQGLSFGGDSESSFQSGKTLFRKVKSIQYGVDGKAYEYTLDLGAIPKAAKETAKLHGWRFKTVINKKKAMYPEGYVATFSQPTQQSQPIEQTIKTTNSFCTNCGMSLTEGAKFCDKCGKPIGDVPAQTPVVSNTPQSQATVEFPQQSSQNIPQQSSQNIAQQTSQNNPQQPTYNNPQGTFYADAPQKASGKGSIFGLIAFILLGFVLIGMLFVAEVSTFGWIFSIVLFAAAFFLQRKMKNRGCLFQLVLWVVTAFLLLISLALFSI